MKTLFEMTLREKAVLQAGGWDLLQPVGLFGLLIARGIRTNLDPVGAAHENVVVPVNCVKLPTGAKYSLVSKNKDQSFSIFPFPCRTLLPPSLLQASDPITPTTSSSPPSHCCASLFPTCANAFMCFLNIGVPSFATSSLLL